MRRIIRTAACGLLLLAAASAAQAQTFTSDLLKDIDDVEGKFVALAGALSPQQYGWRPGEGVRSVQEVLLHVASDNYFLPAVLGVAAPAATKITATDFAAVQAFEKQALGRDAVVAELRTSFEHFERAVASIPESRMNEKMTVFGQEFTVRGFLILSATHLHEHLGQLIAYARVNGVTPPWSR